MTESNCSICLSPVDGESADILTMGAYGTPKCLCDGCSALMRTATSSRDYDEICAAMDEVGRRIFDANIDDRRVIATVSGIFDASRERAERIKDGSYDFSLDTEEPDEEAADVPEELLESEEDRALDERDEEKRRKWDKILNWVSLGIIAAAVAFIIWYFVG